MSTPTLLAIVLNLQATLQGINGGPTYTNTLKASSVRLDPTALMTVDAQDVPMLIVGHRIEPLQRSIASSRPNTVDEWRNVVIEACVDAAAADTASKMTAMMGLEADVEIAITRAAWIHAGGSSGARDALVQQATYYLGLEAQNRCYLEIPVTVKFNRTYGAP